MNLSQQLEDKKKGCGLEINQNNYINRTILRCSENTEYCPKCKYEIAILEQAIAEMKKQRQEEIEYWKRFENLLICSNEFNICKESVAKMKEWDFYKKRIEQLQSQKNKIETPSSMISSSVVKEEQNKTGSADISNLLQKQRQEIFRVKVCNLMGMEENEEFFGNREDAKNRFDEIIEDYRKNKDLMKDDAISGLYYPVNFYNEQPKDNILENVNIALWGKCETDCGTEYTEEWSTIYLEKIELNNN